MIKLPALAGALALACTATQAAHATYQRNWDRLGPTAVPHYNWRTLSTNETIRAQQHLITLDRHVLRMWVASRWTRLTAHVATSTPSRLSRPMPAAIRWRQKHLAWTLRELHERLRQATPTTASHWALWHCITNGAYPGAHHEGNGYNGPYSGPLGMTTPWAGHYPTGSDWVHTPVGVVYGYAEQEYARNGYSRSWLEGQWPQTSPPCLGFA